MGRRRSDKNRKSRCTSRKSASKRRLSNSHGPNSSKKTMKKRRLSYQSLHAHYAEFDGELTVEKMRIENRQLA